MNFGLIFRTLGVWFILVIAAILNGGFRNAVITPSFGEQTGHAAYAFVKRIPESANLSRFGASLKVFP